MSEPNKYTSNFQIVPFTLTPVLDVAAYALSDVLFFPTLLPVVALAQNFRKVRVEIMELTIIDKGNQKGSFDLVFCTTAPASFGAANAPCAISDADAGACVRKLISVTAYTELAAAANAIAAPAVAAFIMEVPEDATGFYLAAISRDTKTYAPGDLVISIGVKFHNMPQA